MPPFEKPRNVGETFTSTFTKDRYELGDCLTFRLSPMPTKYNSRSDLTRGFVVLAGGLALLPPSMFEGRWGVNGKVAIGGLIVSAVGLIRVGEAFFRTRRLPKKEVMQLAQERQGLLTLSEITTPL